MIAGWISYAIIFLIGLSLVGIFGDTSSYHIIYGIVLIVLFIWWILRRAGVVPTF